jgi:methionyl-tRNA formyltransferase
VRLVFMGTPRYAVPTLDAMWRAGHEVLVVTRPDAPQGRGRQLGPAPVRIWAEAHGLKVLTPARFDAETVAALTEFRPTALVTAAYGLILPPAVLALAPHGAYNVHASLLPRWRGPNPVGWAIRAGDAVTGVTLMAMDAGVDTGPIVAQRGELVRPDDTVGTLTDRLAQLGAELVAAYLPRLAEGPLPARAQPPDGSRAPKFRPEEARIDFLEPAWVVSARVRSMLPEPGPYTTVGGVRVLLLDAWVEASVQEPRTIRQEGETWIIGCGIGSVRVTRIRPAGRRDMTPGAFSRGLRPPPTRVDS